MSRVLHAPLQFPGCFGPAHGDSNGTTQVRLVGGGHQVQSREFLPRLLAWTLEKPEVSWEGTRPGWKTLRVGLPASCKAG